MPERTYSQLMPSVRAKRPEEGQTEPSPIDAINELISNSLENQASIINVSENRNSKLDLESIKVVDNGNGLSHQDATQIFNERLPSRLPQSTPSERLGLSGWRGRGRLRALTLGNQVTWHFTYQKNASLWSFMVEGDFNQPTPFRVWPERRDATATQTGCSVEISKIVENHKMLFTEQATAQIVARFSGFLRQHAGVKLWYFGDQIQPLDNVRSVQAIDPIKINSRGETWEIQLECLFWKRKVPSSQTFLCSRTGIPFRSVPLTGVALPKGCTVYIKSDFFEMVDRVGRQVEQEAEVAEELEAALEPIKRQLREFFRDRELVNDEEVLEQLRSEGIYPYATESGPGSPRNNERALFDLCTINICRNLPTFREGMDRQSRQLMLYLVKEALRHQPENVGRIVADVCQLPDDEMARFFDLIDSAS